MILCTPDKIKDFSVIFRCNKKLITTGCLKILLNCSTKSRHFDPRIMEQCTKYDQLSFYLLFRSRHSTVNGSFTIAVNWEEQERNIDRSQNKQLFRSKGSFLSASPLRDIGRKILSCVFY